MDVVSQSAGQHRMFIFWVQMAVGLIYLLTVTYVWAAPPATQPVTVQQFHSLQLQGDASVHLHRASSPWVQVHGQPGAAAQVTFESSDGVLYIESPSLADPQALRLDIGVTHLDEVVFNGRGSIAATGLQGATLVLEGLGAGTFEMHQLDLAELVIIGTGNTQFSISGQVTHQSIEIAGNGDYRGRAMRSQTTQLSVRGNGRVDLWADALLDVRVYGDAHVRYAGAPWVHRKVFGQGAVQPLAGLRSTSL